MDAPATSRTMVFEILRLGDETLHRMVTFDLVITIGKSVVAVLRGAPVRGWLCLAGSP